VGARLEHESCERASCSVRVVNKGDAVLVVARFHEFDSYGMPSTIIEARVVRVRGDMLWWRHEEDFTAVRVSFADRGLTWCPAWREKEVAALRVQHALGAT
jgi:hypothetical protein